MKKTIQLALLLSLSAPLYSGSTATDALAVTKRNMTFAENKESLYVVGGSYLAGMMLEAQYDPDDLWKGALPEYFQKEVEFKQQITKLKMEKRDIENRIKRYEQQFQENGSNVQRRLKKAKQSLNKTIQELTGVQADSEAFRNEYRTAQHEFIKKNKILQKKTLRMGGSLTGPQLHMFDKVKYYVPKVIKFGALANLGTYLMGSYYGTELSLVPVFDTAKVVRDLNSSNVMIDCSDEENKNCEMNLVEYLNDSFRDDLDDIEVYPVTSVKEERASSSIQ